MDAHGATHGVTHAVTNVVAPLADYNVYATDLPLQDAVARAGAADHTGELAAYGATLGAAETLAWAEDANRHPPVLQAFDRVGNRIDHIDFHPSWHAVMRLQREAGLVAGPFADTRPGAW